MRLLESTCRRCSKPCAIKRRRVEDVMELVREGHPDDVVNALQRGWCTINQTDKMGRSALYWATKKNKIKMIDALINFPGADHRVGSIAKFPNGTVLISPLWIAATRGFPEACHRLLRADALPPGIGHRIYRRHYTPLEAAAGLGTGPPWDVSRYGIGYTLEGGMGRRCAITSAPYS